MFTRRTAAAAIAAVASLLAQAATAQAIPPTGEASIDKPPLPAGGVLKIRAAEPGATVMGNLTVTGAAAPGYASIYPCTEGPLVDSQGNPATSSINYTTGKTVSNFAAAKADNNGDICVYTRASAHLIWDQSAETTRVWAHNAKRLLDTRRYHVQTAVAPKRTVVYTGDPNTTVMGNLTVVAPSQAGHTRIVPCEGPIQGGSVNNYRAGQTVSNFAVARTDANGEFCIYSSTPAHLLWDQTVEAWNMDTFTPMVRDMDTRSKDYRAKSLTDVWPSTYPAGTKVPAGYVAVTVPTGVINGTVLGNLTVVGPEAGGYTSVFPCEEGLPVDANGNPATSASNYGAGETVPNLVAAKTDIMSEACFYTRAGTHLVFDVAAEASFSSHAPVRLADTRVFAPATPPNPR